MVKNLSQNGSAHTVIIIGLVIALIGSLGFIFWQNYSIDKTQVETSTVDDTNVGQVTNESAGTESEYITLNEWGVKFKIPEGNSEIKFYKNTDIGFYDFTTARVEALGGSCVDTDAGSTTRMAGISRSTDKVEEPIGSIVVNDNQSIDGYYYYVSGAQAVCSDDGYDIQGEDRNMLVEMLINPISVKSN